VEKDYSKQNKERVDTDVRLGLVGGGEEWKDFVIKPIMLEMLADDGDDDPILGVLCLCDTCQVVDIWPNYKSVSKLVHATVIIVRWLNVI